MNVVEKLSALLGDKILTGDALSTRYVHIWKMDEPLQALAVVLPHSTEDVSLIMKTCSEYNQSVVVHGGLTNLVGSTETTGDEIVISLEKMDTIEEVDTISRTITTQSGVILENIQTAATENGLFFPLNFGAKGSAQVGGIISTNAGGLRVFRYGMTRALVLGLEVVLADGTIINSLKKIIKDNSAYDIKQSFIGAEGTLGIVTRAVLKLVEPSTSRTSAFVAFNDYSKVVSFLKYMDAGLAGTLSGYELIWGETYKIMTSPPAQPNPPLPHGYTYYVLLEGLGCNYEQDQARMESLLADAMGQEMFQDATLAMSDSDLEWFWTIREDVHVIKSHCSNDHHFDISLPIPLIGPEVEVIKDRLRSIDGVECVYPFGHIADGNIHLVIGKKDDSPELKRAIDMAVYQDLNKVGGSVSAEHGIGVHKKDYLSLCRTPEEIDLMKRMKRMLDPLNILNPGKVLDV